MKVYLDNAATTPLAPEVIEMTNEMMKSHFGNPSSIHSYGRESKIIVENSRKTIAKLLNTSPSSIFFTSGGTEADNMAIRCGILDNNITHAITSSISHKAVIYPLEELKEKNHISLDYIKLDSNGRVDLNHLDTLLKNKEISDFFNEQDLLKIIDPSNYLGAAPTMAQRLLDKRKLT